MMDCTFVTKSMFSNPLDVHLGGTPDFLEAKTIADEKAREMLPEPMLLAWFDRNTGKFSPDVICCDREKPSWLVYAESRGGNLTVDINDEDFVFVYRNTGSDVITH